ncbi:YiaA/YiaB family inner membrane protein, partial [Escherichia coli]|uniref:YiaA/YiaB family inner membrane protein n=1 Tax=Escherichia coli TaxID=562 RepID=UPI0035709634
PVYLFLREFSLQDFRGGSFYGLAFFLSLFGAVAVQKNIRDAGINPPKETQITQEEYSE